jgi:hypothetical protein
MKLLITFHKGNNPYLPSFKYSLKDDNNKEMSTPPPPRCPHALQLEASKWQGWTHHDHGGCCSHSNAILFLEILSH